MFCVLNNSNWAKQTVINVLLNSKVPQSFIFYYCMSFVILCIKDSALAIWLTADMMEENSEHAHTNHELWWAGPCKTVRPLWVFSAPSFVRYTQTREVVCVTTIMKRLKKGTKKLFMCFSISAGKETQQTMKETHTRLSGGCALLCKAISGYSWNAAEQFHKSEFLNFEISVFKIILLHVVNFITFKMLMRKYEISPSSTTMHCHEV